ncbi:hypothetical protein [Parendozoicomonas haliclonae]|uniref:Uncharacterized protein n=1 Tax=Parendozoicomonas haliclonae TaxID=1960125 RepID=A0A1X7AGA7_9GAMM|nr:hypothetical protein [Parendozoicomonas haliclonae]SMA38257.1 hypothetical protein EHSB41UT_00860 [Parendozoicomonas haliclonae]
MIKRKHHIMASIIYLLWEKKIIPVMSRMFPAKNSDELKSSLKNSMASSIVDIQNMGETHPDDITLLGNPALLKNGAIIAGIHIGDDSKIQIKLNSLGITNMAIEGNGGFIYRSLEKKMTRKGLRFIRGDNNALHKASEALRNDAVIYISADIRTQQTTTAKLLNTEFYVSDFPFYLAELENKPLYLSYIINNDIHLEPIEALPTDDVSSLKKIQSLKAAYYKRASEVIAQYPEEWCWMLIGLNLIKPVQ